MWCFHFELIFIQYKQGRGKKTKGLGRLSGRSGLAGLRRAAGSDWEPTAGRGNGAGGCCRGMLCAVLPGGAQRGARPKRLDRAGQRERDGSGLFCLLGQQRANPNSSYSLLLTRKFLSDLRSFQRRDGEGGGLL